jgi:hypothetical protein
MASSEIMKCVRTAVACKQSSQTQAPCSPHINFSINFRLTFFWFSASCSVFFYHFDSPASHSTFHDMHARHVAGISVSRCRGPRYEFHGAELFMEIHFSEASTGAEPISGCFPCASLCASIICKAPIFA